MKLDLHGVKHQDVKRQLDVFFWEAMTKKISQIEVVTGHSKTMKDLVYETCNEYGFVVKDGLINKGYLIVDL
jgi:DNA-nicking Smr family endonuclease